MRLQSFIGALLHTCETIGMDFDRIGLADNAM